MPALLKRSASRRKCGILKSHSVTNFRNVMAEFAEFDPHLVLMDIGLPFFNGYYWCGEIRKVSRVPVIFISSASDNMI